MSFGVQGDSQVELVDNNILYTFHEAHKLSASGNVDLWSGVVS